MLHLSVTNRLYIRTTSQVTYTVSGIENTGVTQTPKLLAQGTSSGTKLLFTATDPTDIDSISIRSVLSNTVSFFLNGTTDAHKVFEAVLDAGYSVVLGQGGWKVYDASGLEVGGAVTGEISFSQVGSDNDVDISTISAGDNIIGRVKLTDGTDVADILDLANSNPLAVALVDGAGTQITSLGGSGTEYTEGATDASITGTAVLMEVAADTLQPVQGTVADGLLVNLGANNDISGTVTANAGTNLNTSALALEVTLQSVKTAVEIIDNFISGSKGLVTEDNSSAIRTALEIIDNAILGAEMQVDVITMPVVTIQDGGGSITVDGTVSTGLTQPLTDVQLRATPVPVSGTITANAGSNLNTSALGLEATLQAVKTAVEIIDNTVAGSEIQVDVITLPNQYDDTLTYTSGILGNLVLGVQDDDGSGFGGTDGRVTPLATDALGRVRITGEVAVTSVPGTVVEDSVGLGGVSGPPIIGFRNDSGANLTSDNGDFSYFATDGAGRIGIADLGGSVTVDDGGGSITVDGTFFQATQPVSAASLPLPTGAATAARQDTQITSLANLDVALSTRLKPADTLAAVTTLGTITNTVPTKEIRSTAPTTTTVSDTATSTTILASNTNRLGATIENDSSGVLFLLLGAGTASATNYSVRMVQYAYFETPYGYTGAISGVWGSDPNDGGARITELIA